MAAEIRVRGTDGGLGFRGPDGNMLWAAFGVASKAKAIGEQEPLVITSPGDAETLLGVGPLRDEIVHALTGTGSTVVAMPLVRSAGGTRLGTGAIALGAFSIASVAGHSLGQESVTIEATKAGAKGTAAFRLIVNGKALPEFTPAPGDYAAAIVIPEASLGPLATGVATADQMKITITDPTTTEIAKGATASWNMGEPAFANSDIAMAVTKLGEHQLQWRVCIPAGHMAPAAWTAYDTAIRTLPLTGRFVRGLVQLAGPALVSGAATAALTPAWNSAQLALTGTPAKVDNPRTGAVTNWTTTADPIQGRDRVVPATYALAAAITARQSWEPPDATKHGPLVTDPRTRVKVLNVKAIHPADFTLAQARAQDAIWLTTLRKYSGRAGIYPTHVRLWGEAPSGGITGSDFIGIERGLLLDEICESIYDRLFEVLNDRIETGPDGRMSVAARDSITALASGGVEPFVSARAIAAYEVTVQDADPGILQTSQINVRLRIQPYGKAEVIDVEVGFAAGLNVLASEEVAA